MYSASSRTVEGVAIIVGKICFYSRPVHLDNWLNV